MPIDISELKIESKTVCTGSQISRPGDGSKLVIMQPVIKQAEVNVQPTTTLNLNLVRQDDMDFHGSGFFFPNQCMVIKMQNLIARTLGKTIVPTFIFIFRYNSFALSSGFRLTQNIKWNVHKHKLECSQT